MYHRLGFLDSIIKAADKRSASFSRAVNKCFYTWYSFGWRQIVTIRHGQSCLYSVSTKQDTSADKTEENPTNFLEQDMYMLSTK